jgi:hypothetical protein
MSGLWFTFKSNGGCPICDSMDQSRFESEPPRPHPNCSCTVVQQAPDCGFTKAVEYVGAGAHTDTEIVMIFSYEVFCRKTGENSAGVVLATVQMDYHQASFETDSPITLLELGMMQALGRADEVGRALCGTCPPDAR